jgi:phosphatidate cytidylyltransferase
MLKQRIITALALLAVLLPALFADSPQPFLLLSILLIGAGAWEQHEWHVQSPVHSLGRHLC